MIHFIHTYLPWVLSTITFLGVWQIGHHKRLGWKIGIVTNLVWIIYDLSILKEGGLGLIPLSAALFVMYVWQLQGYRVGRLWRQRASQRVYCTLCGGSHVPNGIGVACVPYEDW